MDILLTPARIATSKPAQRTYLNTLLVTIASTILLGVAVLAYATFYWNYIPRTGVERVIHLQYNSGPNPYGITSLQNELVQQQQYDIALTLHVPRSPRNIDKGNFMVAVNLLRDTYIPPPPPSAQRAAPLLSLTTQGDAITAIKKDDIITVLRRTAILTYSSRLISLSSRLLSLPLYLIGLRKESEILHIPLAELLSFEGRSRSNVPSYAVVEIEAGQEVQVYSVTLSFTARFGGLRWWMYNHRVVSALIGISSFWTAEVLSTLLGWVLVKWLFRSRSSPKQLGATFSEDSKPIKQEQDDRDDQVNLSDTERTFPTYGRNKKPLKWESDTSPRIKLEDAGVDEKLLEEVAIQPLDADDEDDELDGFRDSGVGTSYSDAGVNRGGSKSGRRRNRMGRHDGDD